MFFFFFGQIFWGFNASNPIATDTTDQFSLSIMKLAILGKGRFLGWKTQRLFAAFQIQGMKYFQPFSNFTALLLFGLQHTTKTFKNIVVLLLPQQYWVI